MGDTGSRELKDRSTGLVLFGLIEIVVGALAALVVPLGLLLLLAPGMVGAEVGMEITARTLLPGLSFYAVVAAVFVGLGLGSIRARRWARSLTLVVAWLWLLMGIMSLALAWLTLPVMLEGVGGMLPPGALLAVQLLIVAVLGVFWIALPTAFILFYRRADVEATCRRRDPEPGWVDSCPPAVQSLAVVWVLTGYMVVLMPAYRWVVPFFGVVLDGWSGAAVLVPGLALCLYLARGALRVDIGSWWMGVAVCTLGCLSAVITFLRVEGADFIAAMELPADQLELVSRLALDQRPVLVSLAIATWASFVGYLWWVKRYFATSDSGSGTGAGSGSGSESGSGSGPGPEN